jgi:hypothetical protein
MAQIVETILSDRRISLGAEEYYRQCNFGANWGKIRIGIRFAINGRSDIVDPAYIQLGLGVDANSYWSSDRPTGAICCRFGGSVSNHPNITFNAVQANNSYYQFASTEVSAFWKDASGVVNTAGDRLGSGGVYYAVANSATATPHEFFATFTRAGNGYGLNDVWYPQATVGAVQTGKTVAQFQADMINETAVQPAITNVSRVQSGFGPYAFGSGITFPPVSYISVLWTKSTPTLEIANLEVCKFY